MAVDGSDYRAIQSAEGFRASEAQHGWKANVRTLPHQEDFNRAWPGTAGPDTSTATLLWEVFEIARRESNWPSPPGTNHRMAPRRRLLADQRAFIDKPTNSSAPNSTRIPILRVRPSTG